MLKVIKEEEILIDKLKDENYILGDIKNRLNNILDDDLFYKIKLKNNDKFEFIKSSDIIYYKGNFYKGSDLIKELKDNA